MRVLRLAALLLLALAAPAPAGAATIAVRGNHLVDGHGRRLVLHGVNRSGLEYSCAQGYGFFDGPSSAASIRAMRAWHIDAVRVPLNESCWLGAGQVPRRYRGERCRRQVGAYVHRLEAQGLYAILDLHWAAPGRHTADHQLPMADVDHAPAFWRSLAARFRGDRHLLFDLYNEPFGIGWRCWRDGCTLRDPQFGRFRAAGMAALVRAVRSTGARQPLLLGGLDYARVDDEWARWAPRDPVHALVVSEHTYDFAPCPASCEAGLAGLARRHPVVTGELGEGDCAHGYIDPYMAWADAHAVSYLAWEWNAVDRYTTCRNGPSLIRDYAGHPTAFGVGYRDHLAALARGG